MMAGKRLAYLLGVMTAAILLAGGLAVAATISGTAGNDTLVGTANDDQINGFEGDDFIQGMSGRDLVIGSVGDDTLYGGRDDSSNVGGNDEVNGHDGADLIVGGSGTDDLRGGLGNDTIYDAPSRDTAMDTIYGGEGDDYISIVGAPASRDNIVSCGPGVDEVVADGLDTVAADCEMVNDTFADISFSRPLSVSETLQFAEDTNAQILTLEDDYVVGGVEHQDTFVAPPDVGAASLAQAYEQNRLDFFKDVTSAETVQSLTIRERTELAPQHDAMRAAVASGDAGQITVTGALLGGEEQDLQTLAGLSAQSAEGVTHSSGDGGLVATVDLAATSTVKKHQIDSELAESAAGEQQDPDEPNDDGSSVPDDTVTTAARATYWPNRGISYVGRSQVPGKRYVLQYFEWFNNTLGYADTYEQDFLTENGGGRHYLTGRQNNRCKPVTSYTSHNFPRGSFPYLDTNFAPLVGCERKVLAYVIGAASAGSFRNRVLYYTYIRTPNGNALQDRAKLRAQRGFRAPGWCTSAFCVFADRNGTRPLIDIKLPGEDHWYGIPGTRRWTEE